MVGKGPRLIKKGNKMLIPLIRFLMMNTDIDDVTGGSTDQVEVPDISVYQAKIDELTNVVAERDAIISSMTESHASEINTLKSANYDLLMQIPNDASTANVSDGTTTSGNTEVDANVVSPDINDLFEESK